jgi:spore germination protein YaaH
MRQYNLAGAAFWRKGFETPNLWQGFGKHELT